MLPRIYLIRHGETAWSLSGQHTGRSDLPLTEHGEEEARQLGRRLEGVQFAFVLTSPLQRARRTCELAIPYASVQVEPDLAEWNYGSYEGKHSAEIQRERPSWNVFSDGCPSGESPSEVSARADRLICKFRLLQGNVAIVSHGHFGRALGVRWINLPIQAAQRFLLGTASLSVLDYEHSLADSPVIALWNASSKG